MSSFRHGLWSDGGGGLACPRHTGPSRHFPLRWCKKPQETGPSACNGADRKTVVPKARNARQRNSIKTSWGKKASTVTGQVVSNGIWQNLCQSDGGIEDREIYTNRVTPLVCRVHGPRHVAFLFQRKTGWFGWSSNQEKHNQAEFQEKCVDVCDWVTVGPAQNQIAESVKPWKDCGDPPSHDAVRL